MKSIIRKTMTPDWDRVGIEVPISKFSGTTNLEDLPGSTTFSYIYKFLDFLLFR